MSDKDFVKKYLEDFSSLVKPNAEIIEKITSVRDILIKANENGGWWCGYGWGKGSEKERRHGEWIIL